MVRKFTVAQALESYPALAQHLNDLTEEEVLAALELEAATQRRGSMLSRLISRAVRLNEVRYANQLKEKYCGTSQKSSVRR